MLRNIDELVAAARVQTEGRSTSAKLFIDLEIQNEARFNKSIREKKSYTNTQAPTTVPQAAMQTTTVPAGAHLHQESSKLSIASIPEVAHFPSHVPSLRLGAKP